MRVEITGDELDDIYPVLTSVVIPRPIAWVSTRSAAGVDNLAPHSFFTVSSVRPPIVQFTSVGRKDSVVNAEATGEFVVNFTPAALFEQINATATPFPPGTSEFDAVGVEREPSAVVAPARVARSPVALECTLHSVLPIGDSFVVFGRVVHVAIAADMYLDGRPQADRLAPLARLGANEWSELGPVSSITRIPLAEWPGHYDRG